MKVKNLNDYDLLLNYTFDSLNEISSTLHQINVESNENIINEMYNDLLIYLKETNNLMQNKLTENQVVLIQRNNNNISEITYNIRKNNDKNIVLNELSKLYESYNCNIKEFYFDNEYEDENINKIIENYISNYNNILIVNNDLYRKEVLCIENVIKENFNNIYHNTLQGLLESNNGKMVNIISNIKTNFGNKHDKIIARDKKWLANNKKDLLNKDYTGTQIEVVNDYKITFEMLLNRHFTFDKVFINTPDKLDENLKRFEDKRGDLKNGLDNFYRTGSSKREVGLRKFSDEEIQPVIKLLVDYCQNFLAGRKYIEEKLNNILQDLNDEVDKNKEVTKETYLFKDGINLYKLYTLTEADKDDVDENIYEDELNNSEFKDDDDTDDEGVDDIENDDEKDDIEEAKENNRSMRDRQIGLAVLLNVAEERYFDYINILKGLMEE